ncbi:MAG: hypothetical protein KBB37_05185 [Bacteroidia bacterium]|nr:hypothetical protein [Bacteroidia bacterium]MBP7260661.1 hypothetical protein [Bacteroidia bacterium]MBP9180666.1 hypothetical protein [Bacteroidia bacterium]MBP9724303.1 hypothetical protein [Bacteroidia bacterium]
MTRSKKTIQRISTLLLLTIGYEICFPAAAWALTSGPSQPEVQSFEPVGTTEMVDLSSGDFNYNIPLLDVEGYPINIAYHAGVTMDQEASWVGLGWNINPGSINRNMRGLPDDFDGSADDPDKIEKLVKMKEAISFGLSTGPGFEILGIKLIGEQMNVSLGVNYNNYKGVGYEIGAGPSVSIMGDAMTFGLGLSANSQEGFGVEPSVSYSAIVKEFESKEKPSVKSAITLDASVSAQFNSRSGLSGMSFGLKPGTNLITTTPKKDDTGKDVTDDKGNVVTETKVRKAGSFSFGSGISFVNQTYSPSINQPMSVSSFSLSYTQGAAAKTTHPNLTGSGYYSQEQPLYQGVSISKPAFGYLYTHKKNSNNVLLDFNREGEGVLSENTQMLPLVNYTYDQYVVTGQGIGAQYRPYRSDINILHDDVGTKVSSSGSAGVKLGGGPTDLHLGGSMKVNNVDGVSAPWSEHALWSVFGYSKDYSLSVNGPGVPIYPHYEPAYFKNVGELTPTDEAYYAVFGNEQLVRPYIKSSTDYSLNPMNVVSKAVLTKPSFIIATQEEANTDGIVVNTSHQENIRKKRDKRNQNISYLTSRFARSAGLSRTIDSYTISQANGNQQKQSFERMGNHRKGHHISEITAMNPSGMKYVYGIPAYNLEQQEFVFNVDPTVNITDAQTGLCTYTNTDKSEGNAKGFNKYFSKTKTPAFVHSYLLTEVLSNDYVDVTGDGVTFNDDLGSAVKLKYSLVTPSYLWRTPVGKVGTGIDQYKTASYNQESITDADDDNASLVCGAKEIWHVTAIESRNYIAEFTLSDREDAIGADENGTLQPGNKLKKLDKITLYSRRDRELNGANAVPIKTVHFEYDYSLCPDVPNNTGSAVNVNGVNINSAKGKLTLKKIFFTYGKSNKAALSPYRFSYSSNNPSYMPKAYDRWGSYRPINSVLSNAEFPYVNQQDASVDEEASAWCLKEITLPSGGKISIGYEADDYAFVQHKRAMQMVRLIGAGHLDGLNAVPFNELYTIDRKHHECLFFQLSLGTSAQTVLKDYFLNQNGKPIDFLNFTILVDLKGDQQHFEYVRGYADIKLTSAGLPDVGVANYVLNNENITVGYVKLKSVGIGDRENANTQVGQLARAAWQYMRLQKPKWAYPGSEPKNTEESSIRGLLSSMGEVKTLFSSFNRTLQNRGCARLFTPQKSWIRLYNPDYKKRGGGHRVKEIRLTDNWAGMSGITNPTEAARVTAEYGQSYTYTTSEDVFGVKEKVISSGVASYEPAIGNDENPWRQPLFTSVENLMAIDEKYFVEIPFGESFFPSPGVTYSKVTVSNIKPAGASITKNATGKVVHEFYTTRDYPTIVANTHIKPIRHREWSVIPMESEDYLTCSQGYIIELNDMNGKPKAQWVYSEGAKTYQSGVEYFYKSEHQKGNRVINKLNNKVSVFDKTTNRVENDRDIGVEIDFYMDSRESNMNAVTSGVQFTTDMVIAAVAPVPFPMAWPVHNAKRIRSRSMVATKVVSRFGILQKTIVHDNKASVETENLLYDSETGNVLLTRTQNEFRDDIFDFKYLSHFAYEGMSGVYKNSGLMLHGVSASNGVITAYAASGGNGIEHYLYPGDELLLFNQTYPGLTTKAWVHKSDKAPYPLLLIDEKGLIKSHVKLINPQYPALPPIPVTVFSILVVKSGRKNLQNTVIGQTSSQNSPVQTIVPPSGPSYSGVVFNTATRVIHTKAIEFSDIWAKYCEPAKYCEDQSATYGPFLTGMFDYLFEPLPQNPPNLRIDIPGDYTVPAELMEESFLKHILDSMCPMQGEYVFKVEHTYESSSNPGAFLFIWKVGLCKKYPDPQAPGSYLYCCMNQSEGGCGFNFRFSVEAEQRPLLEAGQRPAQENEFVNIIPSTELVINGSLAHDYLFNFNIKRVGSIEFEQAQWHHSTDPGLRPQMKFCEYYKCDCESPQNKLSFINPYLHGLRGNWRPKREFLYDGRRSYSNPVNTRKDGTYESYLPFWTPPSSPALVNWTPSPVTPWVWANRISHYSPAGNEIENEDALHRYSAALYAKNNLTEAVGSNARLRQIAFDGFEDLSYQLPECEQEHWNFKQGQTLSNLRDNAYAHTGSKSFKVGAGGSHSVTRRTFTPPDPVQAQLQCLRNDYHVYRLRTCDCIDPFYPDVATQYVLSAWVRDEQPRHLPSYTAPSVKIVLKDNNPATPDIVHIVKASGPVIEGWQRMEQTFTIPSQITSIAVVLEAGTERAAWFDDIRIHPFNGNLKSFVYDPVSLKLRAELDENNFATFYEYDQQGALIRVKKETVKGIVTLKSARSSTVKQ